MCFSYNFESAFVLTFLDKNEKNLCLKIETEQSNLLRRSITKPPAESYVSSLRALLLRGKERRRVGRNLDNSADKVVDVGVASQLPSAQR